ncbi:serine hydrolase [Nocardiopsis sediminis]|uniref:Beta-lactamase n=1 Tax=Nocardiopsis sediminis TaxID=1778267 RepID=A0ABV8FNG0_9ACTN
MLRTPALTPGRARTPGRHGALARLTAVATGAVLALGVAAPEARAGGSACTSDAHPQVAVAIDEVIERITAERAGDIAVGVAAFNGELTCTHRSGDVFDAVNAGEIVVLAALLRRAPEEERGLSPEEDQAATRMITRSDAAATGWLRDHVGTDAMQRFIGLAGMPGTRLHPDGTVGLMKTNAADQLRLLELITEPNDVLGDDQRAYARRLMGEVDDEQRWGVLAGAPEGAEIAAKNGWLHNDGTDAWRANSVGIVDGTGIGPYRMVVLTDGNTGRDYGVRTIELISREVHAVLNGTPVRVPVTPAGAPGAA